MTTVLTPLDDVALKERAAQFGLPPFDLRKQTRPLTPDPLFGEEMIWRLRAVPIFVGQHHVAFAMDDPSWVDDVDTLHHLFGKKVVHIRVADPAVLEAFMTQHYIAGKARGQQLRERAKQML